MASKNGDIWINNQTEKLRFKVNDKNRTVTPAVWYTAGETIADGSPCGLNSSGKLINFITSSASLNDNTHIRCLGIANNSAAVDEAVELLTHGKKTIAWSKIESNSIDNIDSSADIGKTLFASNTAGSYTLSRESAVLGGNNVVELGILTAYTSSTDFTIDIQLSGDGRGPIGISHVEYTLAEPYFLRNQSGVLEPKVFAVGTDTVGTNLDYTLYFKNSAISNLTNQYFILYNGSWAAGFFFNTTGSVPSGLLTQLNLYAPSTYQTYLQIDTTSGSLATIVANMKAAVEKMVITTTGASATSGTATLTYASGSPIPPIGSSIVVSGVTPSAYNGTWTVTASSSTSVSFLSSATGSQTVAGKIDLLKVGSFTVTNTLVGSDYTSRFQAANKGEVFFYFSGSSNDINGVLNFSSSSLVSFGSRPNAGLAILSDNRFSDRANIIGFNANDTSQSILTAGSTIVIQKLGLITGFSGLTLGKKVYAGQLGGIVSGITSLGGLNIVELGNVKTSSSIDINISTPLEGPGFGFPVGAITKLAVYSFGGTAQSSADYGWKLCDGSTLNKTTYPEYTLVVDYINMINTGSTSSVTATLPTLSGYQIKVLDVGKAPKSPAALYYTQTYTWPASSLPSYYELDYTTALGSLVSYETAKLDKLVVKVFLKKASDSSITELVPGISTTGATYYGYTLTDAYVASPLKYAFRINLASNYKVGFTDTTGTTPYTLATGDQLIVRVYRSENFEYFVGPELTSLRKWVNQDVSTTSSPTFNTINISYLTLPTLTGGSAVSSTLTLKSTSGVGSSDAIIFQVGNNGATEAMRILNAGNVTFGGSIGLTGTRVSKGWFTDLEITNLPSINGTAITTTATKLNYLTSATGTTGTTSTNIVFSTSPTLVTPTLGVATATSINKMSITAPATGSTLAVAEGKTLTSSNTLTFSGTDGSTLNIGSGGTLGTGAYAIIANYAALSGASFTGQVTISATGTSAGGLTLPSTQGLGNIWIA